MTATHDSGTIAAMSAAGNIHWSDVRAGFRAGLPVAAGCAPFGVAYGAVAAATLSPAQTLLMSTTVFAGTAQFVAASMLAQGSSLLPVLLTCALVNLRLLLLSAAISPHLRGLRLAPRLLSAFMLTDESFAVSVAAFRERHVGPGFVAGAGLSVFVLWQAASVVGRLAGSLIPQGYGLEYALAASLICLLFMLVRNRRQWAVALLAILLTLGVRQILPDAWVVLVATLIATTVGLRFKRWQ